jgi:hypothetical protein
MLSMVPISKNGFWFLNPVSPKTFAAFSLVATMVAIPLNHSYAKPNDLPTEIQQQLFLSHGESNQKLDLPAAASYFFTESQKMPREDLLTLVEARFPNLKGKLNKKTSKEISISASLAILKQGTPGPYHTDQFRVLSRGIDRTTNLSNLVQAYKESQDNPGLNPQQKSDIRRIFHEALSEKERIALSKFSGDTYYKQLTDVLVKDDLANRPTSKVDNLVAGLKKMTNFSENTGRRLSKTALRGLPFAAFFVPLASWATTGESTNTQVLQAGASAPLEAEPYTETEAAVPVRNSSSGQK